MQSRPFFFTVLGMVLVLSVAMLLRLLVWDWREFYPLGGDEQEYFNQALTLLREWRYEELRIMRPPLYPLFLAGNIVLFDSLLQNLRLVQAVVSTLTIIPIWLLTRELVRELPPATARPAPWIAAWLWALCYTLAATATELLSETLFLFGLATCFWLLLRTARAERFWRWALAAGLCLGALCLSRAAALPLLPLGMLWLPLARLRAAGKAMPRIDRLLLPAIIFALSAVLLIAPWTLRNYLTYGDLIIIDTTGAENLWLDNDPAGREAVKAQLYALGDDMAARQELAAERGAAVIAADPDAFFEKARGELLKFFALEYADDLQNRPAIWVPPLEIWLRLLLGDALWLLLLLAGSYGLLRHLFADASRRPGWLRFPGNPALLLGAWAAYTLLTILIFHVELRYRLPLYPVLLPYAALVLSDWAHADETLFPRARLAHFAALLVPLLWLSLTLLHQPYPLLALHLGAKQIELARADIALARGDLASARQSADSILLGDPDSALGQVILARIAIAEDDLPTAFEHLNRAIAILPAHPHAHLLRGDLLRKQGELEAAREELAYETNSLQDLQQWSWDRFVSGPYLKIEIGNGLDLGFVKGFHPAEAEGGRWTSATAQLRLYNSGLNRPRSLRLQLDSGRPSGADRPLVEVLINGELVETLEVAPGPAGYEIQVPVWQMLTADEFVVELRSPTFRPRDFDPTSPDGRRLGVFVAGAELVSVTDLP